MTFDLSNVVNKSSASKALERSGIKTTDSSKKKSSGLPPATTAKVILGTLGTGLNTGSMINTDVVGYQKQIQPAAAITTTVVGSAIAAPFLGVSSIVGGAAGLIAGAVGNVISSLETAPKTSPIVQEIEQKTGVATQNLISAAIQNPATTLTALGLAIPVAYTGGKLLSAITKTGSAAVGTNLALSDTEDRLKSTLDNRTASAGGKKKKDKENLVNDTKDIPTSSKASGEFIPSIVPLEAPVATLKAPATEATSLTPGGNLTPILSKKAYKRRKPKEPIKVSQRVNIALVNANRNIYKHEHT